MTVTDRENRTSPLTVLGDGALLVCAMAGFTSSFLSLYGDGQLGQTAAYRATPLDLCAAREAVFLGVAVLFALIVLSVWSLPRFRGAAAGGLTALWGLLVYSNWGTALRGAIVTARTIAAQFAGRVPWGRAFSYDSGLTQAEEGTAARLFLLLFLGLLALALGWAVVRARRWWLALLLTLPPLLPGLLADLYPRWLPFMALALCWCTMLLCDLCRWAAPDRRGLLTLTALPCVGLVLAGVTLLFPMDGYTRPEWALDAEVKLRETSSRAVDFFSRFDGPFQRTVTYVGAAEEADLASAGPLNYFGRTVLRVNSDYDGRLYLRGSSLAVYEGGVWSPLPQGTYEEYSPPDSPAVFPLYFPAMEARDSAVHTVTVDNVGTVGSCVYAPYFLAVQDPDETGALPMEDAYLARRQGQWTHTLSFVDREPPASSSGGVHVVVGGGATAAEIAVQRYASYAVDHYLDVPEELQIRLAELCFENGIYPFSISSTIASRVPVETARSIAALLDELCEYDTEAEPAPEGEDPVLWFLTQSRRGYCMHYASAATLMLRAMGVPARYVSGFTAVSVPGRRVDVPDRAAHAWVEVWVGGFGWYPVEVTPAAAFDWYQQGVIDPEDLPSEPVEETEEPEPTPTPSEDVDSVDLPSDAPQGGDESGDGPDLTLLFAALKALGVVLGVSALLWLGQFVLKRLRARRMSGPDRNRAALACYGCLCRLERWGGRIDERALELAQKARFSQHTLTRDELTELRGMVDRERERLCVVLDPARRLAFRWLWGSPARAKKGNFSENPPENSP